MDEPESDHGLLYVTVPRRLLAGVLDLAEERAEEVHEWECPYRRGHSESCDDARALLSEARQAAGIPRGWRQPPVTFTSNGQGGYEVRDQAGELLGAVRRSVASSRQWWVIGSNGTVSSFRSRAEAAEWLLHHA